ncbi:hypothetical protein BDB01DRAFT_210332 [Pilobolus umbonatus]|nr:hypothetical protein BDB01DRAFT_210332 [Pilobolus umbonatus]
MLHTEYSIKSTLLIKNSYRYNEIITVVFKQAIKLAYTLTYKKDHLIIIHSISSMPLILSFILLCSILLQPIHAFCIYNEMNEGVGIFIRNTYSGNNIDIGEFKKGLPSKGSKECCPYTTKTCNKSRLVDHINHFEFYFYHQSESGSKSNSLTYKARCYAGGALVFHGSKNQFGVNCNHPSVESKFFYPQNVLISWER